MCSFRGSGGRLGGVEGGLVLHRPSRRADGPRAAAMQPRSVSIAYREPSTRAADVEPSRRDVFEREQRKFKGVFLDVLSDALMADIQFRREWERMVTERV